MANEKKILIGLILVLIIVGLGFYSLTGNGIYEEDELVVGAILPLSGPASIWGEEIQKGMEMALDELDPERIRIIYEDSGAKPSQGVSAYRKLVDTDDVDLVVSALTPISKALVPLADKDEKPLLVTVSVAHEIAGESLWVYRFFSSARQSIDPHIPTILDNGWTKIAVLHANDGYGYSVLEYLEEKAFEENIDIVIKEGFTPGSSDFRTQLLKIGEKDPDAILFIGSLPPEILGVVKQKEELGLKAEFIEASAILSVDSVRSSVSKEAEGAYTLAFPFTLDLEGEDFKEKYFERYGKDPFFVAAAMGYDSIYLIEERFEGSSFKYGDFESLNGLVEIKEDGEINPELYSVRVENGELVRG